MTRLKEGANKKVVLLSILALVCLALTYFIHWLFILPIAVILWINHRELFGNQNILKLSEKTKKEIKERRKSKDFISHEEVKKRLGV